MKWLNTILFTERNTSFPEQRAPGSPEHQDYACIHAVIVLAAYNQKERYDHGHTY